MTSDRELLAGLERAVESTFAHVPPAPQDLGRVRQRARAYRLRRNTLRGVAASDTAMYWWQFHLTGQAFRPVYLTYDFASGKLTEKFPATAPTSGYELPLFGMQTNGTRVVQWPAEFGRTCSFETLDAATGERIARLRPEISGCSDVYYALSPDSTRVAALVTSRDAGSWRQRIFFLDATTGKTEIEYATPALAAGTDRAKLVYRLAWAGDRTVRYARGEIGGTPMVKTLTLRR